MLKDVFVEDSLVRLTFSNANFGLAIKAGNSLQGFTIAGEDKKFEWANAVIVNKNEVIVSYPTINKPISVRYAWAASPIEANLINKEGYPVAPFKTDNW